MLAKFILLFILSIQGASASSSTQLLGRGEASTFAGATTSFKYPPNATTIASTYFLDASQVGYAGATSSAFLFYLHFIQQSHIFWTAGDEAAAIETAPTTPKVDNVYPLIAPGTDEGSKKFNLLRHLGNYSPMYSVESFGLPEASAQIPEGCSLKQVHLLHRHGARYPGTGDTAQFAAKIHSAASGSGFSAKGRLAFLNTWTYKLGAEILTPFGREQM